MLTAVKGSNVPAAATNSRSLAVGHGLLRRWHLWRAIRAIRPGEELANERVDIDAEVEPAVALDHHVRDSGVHLVHLDRLCPVAEHQPSSRLNNRTRSPH